MSTISNCFFFCNMTKYILILEFILFLEAVIPKAMPQEKTGWEDRIERVERTGGKNKYSRAQ